MQHVARTTHNRFPENTIKTPALAYLRTSSTANVGAEKDSGKRQRAAIEAHARSAGFELIGEFYDEAISGADKIEDRPGFAALLDRIDGNGVRTILIEDQSLASPAT